MSIQKLIQERGRVYGNYKSACEFRYHVIERMSNLYKQRHGKEMPGEVRVMIEDIIHKLARLAVAPWHIDNLRDIQGYTQLMIEYFKGSE